MDPCYILPSTGGDFESDGMLGFCFSTLALLQNIPHAIRCWKVNLPSEADGTYKILYNGWPLLPFGSHEVYQDDRTMAIHHRFRPFSFSHTQVNHIPYNQMSLAELNFNLFLYGAQRLFVMKAKKVPVTREHTCCFM